MPLRPLSNSTPLGTQARTKVYLNKLRNRFSYDAPSSRGNLYPWIGSIFYIPAGPLVLQGVSTCSFRTLLIHPSCAHHAAWMHVMHRVPQNWIVHRHFARQATPSSRPSCDLALAGTRPWRSRITRAIAEAKSNSRHYDYSIRLCMIQKPFPSPQYVSHPRPHHPWKR